MIHTNSLAAVLGNAQLQAIDAKANGMALAAGRVKMSESQAEKAAQDFESMFLSQMMSQMVGDSLGDEAFGSEDTDEIYKSMMMEQYGKQLASAGGIGIAEYIKRELLTLQEV